MKLKAAILRDHLVVMILVAIFADLLLFRMILKNFVHSRYFKIKTAEELEQIFSVALKHREIMAKSHFSRLDVTESKLWHINNNNNNNNNSNGKSLKLLIVVITVKRKHHDYLLQTVAGLDEQIRQLSEHEAAKIGLLVCNADLHPDDHQEAVFLSDYVQTVQVEMRDRTHSCCNEGECSISGKAKQKSDYFECVKIAKQKFNFQYLLVMEDDSAPLESALQNMLKVFNQKLDHRKEDWFMAKFFYSLKFQGFQLQIFSILELLSLSILTTVCLKSIQMKLFRWRSKLCGEKYSIIPIFVLTMTCIFVIGRQHTLLTLQYFLTPYRTEKAHADANLAIVYPNNKIDVLLDILENHSSCEGLEVDLELHELAERMGDALIWVHGQFFEHIGFKTSLQFKSGEEDTWEFAGQYLYLPFDV